MSERPPSSGDVRERRTAANRANDRAQTGSEPASVSVDNPADAKPAVASPEATPENSATARSSRPVVMKTLVGLFIIAGLAWLAYWLLFLRTVESTDDAYTAGNQVRISSQVMGNVKEILTDNTLPVTMGQVILRLDDTDARLAVERCRADLAETVRQTRRLMLEADRLETLVSLRQAELEKARGNHLRRKNRKTSMAVSQEELIHSLEDMGIAEKALEAAVLEYQSNRALVLETALADQPAVRGKAQELRDAWLAWKRCEIRSPVTGYAARRSVQVGMHVTPGLPLMAVVPLHDIWVDANFKEVQLARMRVGQPVDVRADMYGRSVSYRGTVTGFSAGTGSVFSLLPPENASGNWIKVVQRVPVRIRLAEDDLQRNPLLIGLSCLVSVDVSDTDGAMLPPAEEGGETPLLATPVLEYDTTDIDREIAAIIERNGT